MGKRLAFNLNRIGIRRLFLGLVVLIFALKAMLMESAASSQPAPNPNLVYLPVVARMENAWSMLAANPQRTSWTAEEVRGDLKLEWYRPIEPYIHPKIQPIAALGKIFVSTARGLYAFSASDGALVWVYPTELPLGHSPTIATINGRNVAYVGGFDRKIHAVDVATGQALAGYTPYIASAGFETNPLVINNTIYAGNRDGYFYALDAITGDLKWRFKTGGAISFSAAYKDGVIYFASNDAYAYALNAANGNLIWKSARLPGQGFYSYWAVVYTEKKSGKDYVIFTSGENYKMLTLHLSLEEKASLFGNIPTGSLIGPSSANIPGDWAPGTVVMDASVITNYYQARPDRRTVFVLDAQTGVEFTFDSNRDGKPEYAPFTWSGVTQAGNKYPPVINGVDGVYYQATAYYSWDWISRGGPVGWKFGTQYISRVDGNGIGHASDEPMSYSSGGRLIYWALCCDREAGAMDVTIPFNQPNRSWQYYGYNLANNVLAPGYQQMYFDGNTQTYNDENGWQIYSGKFQSKNGVYGKHGNTQSPPIPYQGKVYLLKGNALLAFSPQGTNPRTPLPLAGIVPATSTSPPPSKAELTQRLEEEIQKMLSAGHLRPGFDSAGFIDLFGNGWYTDDAEFGEIFDYFQNPADTVYTLLLAYPHLSAQKQLEVKNYLKNNYGPGAPYDFTRIVHIGYGSGAPREAFIVPAEDISRWGQPYRSPYYPSTQPICQICGYWKNFPPFSFYAAWKYAVIVGNNDVTIARDIFSRMSGKLEPPLADNVFLKKPYWLNLYIAGYKGYLELEKLAWGTENATVKSRYEAMLALRANQFSKDTPFKSDTGSSFNYNNALAVARNFMFLTPELGDYLSQRISSQVSAAVNEYNYVAPYWFVAKFDVSYGEGTFQHLYDPPALFQAKALILKQPYEELVKWLDVPAFARGDLFYIQNLAFALNANPAP